MYLLQDIKSEICNNPRFKEIKLVICGGKDVETPEEMDKVKFGSAGFGYTKNLFYCALLCYYDKLHNFDEMAVKKLFSWAFILRVDMKTLWFDQLCPEAPRNIRIADKGTERTGQPIQYRLVV